MRKLEFGEERARQSFKESEWGFAWCLDILCACTQGESLPGWAMTTSEERAIIGVVM